MMIAPQTPSTTQVIYSTHHTAASHEEPTRVLLSTSTLYWRNLNQAIFEVLSVSDTGRALQFINEWQTRIDTGMAPSFLEELIEEAAVQIDRQRAGKTWKWNVGA